MLSEVSLCVSYLMVFAKLPQFYFKRKRAKPKLVHKLICDVICLNKTECYHVSSCTIVASCNHFDIKTNNMFLSHFVEPH